MLSIASSVAVASRSAASRRMSVLCRNTLIGSAVSQTARDPLPRLTRGFAAHLESTEAVLAARKSTAMYEAEIAEAEAAAAATKETAEAAAAATKATAEAAAAVSKATAEAAASARASRWQLWRVRAAIGVGMALVLDYIWNDNENVIKWNMKRKLLACALPPTVPESANPAMRLETGQPALELSFIPTALLGPTGSGKSTALKDLARACINEGIPTFLIGFRMSCEDRPKGKEPRSACEAVELMDATSRQVYDQVGFPEHRSIIGPLVDLVVGIVAEAETNVTGAMKASAGGPATLTPSGSRLMTCFTYLFEVAMEVSRERQAAKMNELKAAPVLLFDGLEGLVKDDRLKKAGGQLLLEYLSVLMVHASVDHQFVRIGFAGSSDKMAFALASPAKSFRLSYKYQADPTRQSMLTALKCRKYSAEDAASMVDLCGTRLRLFNGPLCETEPPLAADFMAYATGVAERDFRDVETSLAPDDRPHFAALLDKVEASYSGGLAMLDYGETIPSSAELIDLAPILFVNHKYELKFQSELHRKVWQTERKRPEWRMSPS